MSDKTAARLNEMRARVMRRDATVVSGGIDLEARTVELAFSSETDTVERWFGVEILGHTPGEVDLTRLNNAAPVLWMHDWNDQRGVVVSARIDADGIGRAVVKFSRSPAGEQLFQDIADGIVTKVSVGYSVQAAKLVEEREDVDVYRITSWAPYEISLCSVPADDTVGVGRTAQIPHEEKPAQPGQGDDTKTSPLPEKRTATPMNEQIVRDGQGNLVRAKVDENGAIVEIIAVIEAAGTEARAAEARGLESERARVRALNAVGAEYGRPELATEFADKGKSVEELRSAILADVMKERAKSGKPLGDNTVSENIGMTDKDVRSYSLLKAVRALANPNDKRAQEAAAFELECSAAAQRQYGKEAKGILIPADVLGSRSFNAGTNGQTSGQTGSNIVATDMLAGSFIEQLRNRTTIMRLGTTLGGLVGNIDIPKQEGGASAYWVGEGDDTAEGQPAIGQISLSPKTVGAYTDITRRLMMQSTPDAEGIVIRDLRNAMSQAIDRAGYYGTGTDNMPKGIANYTGLNAVNFAAANPTFKELVQMETEISADNADIEAMAYVANARFRGYAKSTEKFTGTSGQTIWENGGTVNGYGTEITNQIDNGDVFHGNFADLLIALWGGLDLTVDPYTLSRSGGTRIVVLQDVDFVLRQVESLCLGRKAA